VVAQAWRRPVDALEAMVAGAISMWVPTSTTLQQLEHVGSLDEIRLRLSPGLLGEVRVDRLTPLLTRIVMPAGGGVAGQRVCAYLIGRRRFVLVDPGDPTGPALDAALGLVGDAGGRLDAVALTHVDPDHAAGAEAVAERAGVPVLVGPGGGRPLPYDATELADGQRVPAGDIPLEVLVTPGPRPDHLAFVDTGGTFAISGDLDGVRGTRSVPEPVDAVALETSRERLRSVVAPDRWLGGHPRPDEP
jgi:glyoxylase-like metal-dependent hydrolase (beta-lactamase superfamily II)